ncbi:hypothetical protein PtB15_12B421 [Puccinia triticina]|nr:hypothetical protein PtB15_12B421 [Puccinia triticina]
MPTLEQAALSGTLTSSRLPLERDPDGREPDREPEEACMLEDLLASHDEDEYGDFDVHPRSRAADPDRHGFLHPGQQPSSQSTSPAGSQSMSRGWSGNTGPKGVLLDFKASHGKSGAILGGGESLRANYPRQISMSSALASKRSASNSNNTHRASSPAMSDSDSSDSSDRDHHIRTNTALCNSTKTTTRLIFSDNRHPHQHHPRRFASSSSSTSALVNNPRLDARGKKLFGHLREVGVENFIQAVEAEKDDKETVVLVHLYDPALESCLILNNHLSNLARVHPRTKFLRALASELDFFNETPTSTSGVGIPTLGTSPVRGLHSLNLMDDDPFDDEPSHHHHHDHLDDDDHVPHSPLEARTCKATDSDILPTLIWYRSGEYVQSLPALERELPLGGIVRGEQGCRDLQRLLRKNGIINDPESVPL